MTYLTDKAIKIIKLIFNVGFISIVFFNLIERVFYSIPENWLFFLTSDAVENFICALIAFSLYFFVLKLKYIWKKGGLVILFITLLITLSILKDYRIHYSISFQQTFIYFTSFLGQTLLFYSGIYFINRLELLNSYKKLENELNQAKKQLLRNQLHPHFLFNAFNSLYSLSLKNSPDTSDCILKLSSLMRYLTDETHLDKVPLSKEIDFIEKYISIERMRFGKEASIQLTIEGTINNVTLIAPFLLITLVENAFKHGFYTNSKDAFVNIKLCLQNNILLFSVENSVFVKQHFQKNKRTGKGLDNLKQRLTLLYPKNSKLEINNTKNKYLTRLKISLN